MKNAETRDFLVRLWPKTIREARRKYATHLARFHFAGSFVASKSVYDVACGVGYGSYYLAQTAKKVVAIDISEEAIGWATKYFMNDNVEFLVADLARKWPVQDKFDIITSFETMEHLKSPEKFLENIIEHLLPGGTLFLSVPNGPLDLKNHSDNYNHIQHFNDHDLRELMEGHFPKVEYYSQVYVKNIKHYLVKSLRMQSVRLVSNFDFVPDLLPEIKTWYVVAYK